MSDFSRKHYIVSGYVEPQSGEKCGWANGTKDCDVPDCNFAVEQCLVVRRKYQRAVPDTERTEQ